MTVRPTSTQQSTRNKVYWKKTAVVHFTLLHGMPARTSDEKAVCLSVCVRPSVRLSAKRMDCDKREERSVQIFIPHERSFSLVFSEEWLVGPTHSS